jgi:hypothetical protein
VDSNLIKQTHTHSTKQWKKKKPKKIKSMCVRAQEEIEAKKKNKISQDHGIKLASADDGSSL